MQEPRNAAIPLDLDDDTVSVQSQETEKASDTPSSSSTSKSSNDSKESTPQPIDVPKKDVSVEKTTPEQEKKVSVEFEFIS